MSSELKDQIKALVLDVKGKLERLKVTNKVIVNLNGVSWEGTISEIRKHPLYLPDFKIHYHEDDTEGWCSGLQIVFEDTEIL